MKFSAVVLLSIVGVGIAAPAPWSDKRDPAPKPWSDKEKRWDEKRWEEKRWDDKRWDDKRWDDKRWDEKRWDEKRWDEKAKKAVDPNYPGRTDLV
ncbi:uncharacterized protein BCR38DRAFT_522593 [Pseudomassariella vexata]|uniref:Uncharacterized protein n=1 Tax=Pseudomassariella vexata TaxID=1141098 RepID=A0A1Y2E858_9PEZI|nr:uncharacterized protein BCR38DRAFT_522593 [Pseudomassariella vexata]ORY67719.1 hypothetical protein BCR38DRAFT_522593 [Pseudomassariella vexata]